MVRAITLVLAATTAAVLATGYTVRGTKAALPVEVGMVYGLAQKQGWSHEPHPGQLSIIQDDGKVGELCPLERTSVNATISGYGAEVKVTQVFHNPTNETIEAVYTFPLPNDAAVNSMTLRVGDRVVRGTIQRREDARRIYDAAKAQGQTAALLDQERPNIFTQSVANITPGASIHVEIGYVQTLKYEAGTFEFNFPMVVGPRYLGNAPDPDKIAPPITPKGTRTGANIDLTVNLNAGADIQSVKSVLHDVQTQRLDSKRSRITLAKKDEIPNRDFILRYSVATDQVTDAFVAHMESGLGGFFTMALLPPKAPKEQDATPREFLFVMDQSGSQSGFPIEKSKELTLQAIQTLRLGDTFNVYGFNTSVASLWSTPRPATPANIKQAEEYVRIMKAGGGTNIREGVLAALTHVNDPDRLRIVLFNTDGFVGDEHAILDTIQKTRGNARMYTFGIGNSVNRFLIDSMAVEGRGRAEYVTLAQQADEAVERFIRRTRTPILTDVTVEFEGVEVEDVQPAQLPDVFDEAPVYLYGHYLKPGLGKMTIRGKHKGQPWSRTVEVELPARGEAPAVASLWARNKVEDLSRQGWATAFNGVAKDQSEQIARIGLDFGIMTQYTSFVAVEERVVNIGGKQRTVRVPVEMADGVSYEGIFGDQRVSAGVAFARPARGAAAGGFGGGGGGFGGGGGGLPPATAAPSVKTENLGGRPGFDRPLKPEEKIDRKLKGQTGKLEVQVWLQKWDEALLKKMEEKGLKIELKDQKLMIVFGIVDSAKLMEIAKLEEVQSIRPLEE